MIRQPSDDELRNIAERLTGIKGLLVPVQPSQSSQGKYSDGPHFLVAATIYEGEPAHAAQELWNEIRAHDAALMLTDFAGINLLHSKEPYGGAVHELLERKCLTDEQRRLVLKSDPSGLEHRVQLFQQVGILVAMKAIVSCVALAEGDKPRPTWLSIGNLAMAANVFVTGKEYREGQGTSEDARLMMEQLASWEISNSRDLAYSFGRAQIILKKYLRSTDAEVVSACKALSLDPTDVLVHEHERRLPKRAEVRNERVGHQCLAEFIGVSEPASCDIAPELVNRARSIAHEKVTMIPRNLRAREKLVDVNAKTLRAVNQLLWTLDVQHRIER